MPKDLKVKVSKLKLLKLDSDVVEINKLWVRRQTTKFNGVPYIVQRGAAAVFTPEGQEQIMENVNYYRENAKIIADTMDEIGIKYFGGINSPYIWLECPNGMKSWEFFDYLWRTLTLWELRAQASAKTARATSVSRHSATGTIQSKLWTDLRSCSA